MTIIINGTTGVDTPAITGLTTALSAAQGGTGLASVGTSGNVLTSNGTTWTSSALPAGGVTSLNGQTGAITNTSLYAIGSYVFGRPANNTSYAVDSTLAGSSLYAGGFIALWRNAAWNSVFNWPTGTPPLVNTGTWRCVSLAGFDAGNTCGMPGLWVRIS